MVDEFKKEKKSGNQIVNESLEQIDSGINQRDKHEEQKQEIYFKVKPVIVEYNCQFLEQVEMNMLNNQITDAMVQGQVNLKFKSNVKTIPGNKIKKVPIEFAVEDKRWHSKNMFEVITNT
jgi:C4-dicarboxylate-specific signal transduction histidine kinase